MLFSLRPRGGWSVSQTSRLRIVARTGRAFEVAAGQLLRVVDAEGGQVADLVAFAANDPGEWLSNGRSFHYNESIYMVAGSTLYSNKSHPMLAIVEDGVGRHDFLYTPCSAEVFERNYGLKGHPNCLDNLTSALASYNIPQSLITTPFNVFMNVGISNDGRLTILPALSGPGDSITFRAEMDLIVAVSACSGKVCNVGPPTPIDVEIVSS